MKTIEYKSFKINEIRKSEYELIHNLNYCSTDSCVENLKTAVDEILMHDHLDWEIIYYDNENNVITGFTMKNCAEYRAELQAIKNKPVNAVNWSVLQIGLYVWQIFSKSNWWPESQNNSVN